MSDIRLVEGKDEDGNEVKVYVKKPTSVEYRDSQIEYNNCLLYTSDAADE